MKLTKAMMAGLLVAAILVGCSKPPVRGVVVKKNFRPAWTQWQPIVSGRTVVVVPIVHPDRWDVVVQNDGTTGEEGQFLVRVSHEEWDKLEVGGIWERSDTQHTSASLREGE